MQKLISTSKRSGLRARQTAIRELNCLFWFSCMLAACIVAGCKSASPAHYIAPRVEGRVLDADTRQPLAGVQVRRVNPYAGEASREVLKGGQSIEKAPAVRTRSDGAFALASERDLELFAQSSWGSITITVDHAGYGLFTTNYTTANATISPRGEPEVQAGDILLVPLVQSRGR